MKDPAAVALGKRRWAGMTAEQRRTAMAKVQAKKKQTKQARQAAGKRLLAGRMKARKAKK